MAQSKRQVFYSFHFDNDVRRVQQIRQMGALEGNGPASANEWEQLKKKDGGQKKWIDDNMAYRSCVIVLVGTQTVDRPWVRYEIRKASEEKKGLFGIYIHNLKDPNTGTCPQGKNPFDQHTISDGPNKGKPLSTIIKCYNPKASDAYGDINSNIGQWIEAAIVGPKR
jgi:hypothetical protein